MLKTLFFIAFFYILGRYIKRLFLPSSNKNKAFNPFQGNQQSRRRRKNDFDSIEDADYEDLTDKDT